jgi:penicillin-binding protein-related factor A (putative recombinase)
MRLEELKPHQADYLRDNQEINGGISFILVSFRLQRFFVVPWCEWRDERISDLRSFTADDINGEWECVQDRHVALDYLAVVDRLGMKGGATWT